MMERVRLRGNFLVGLPEPRITPGTLAVIRDPGERGVQLGVIFSANVLDADADQGPSIAFVDGSGDVSGFAYTEWVCPDAWDPIDRLADCKEVVAWCP